MDLAWLLIDGHLLSFTILDCSLACAKCDDEKAMVGVNNMCGVCVNVYSRGGPVPECLHDNERSVNIGQLSIWVQHYQVLISKPQSPISPSKYTAPMRETFSFTFIMDWFEWYNIFVIEFHCLHSVLGYLAIILVVKIQIWNPRFPQVDHFFYMNALYFLIGHNWR